MANRHPSDRLGLSVELEDQPPAQPSPLRMQGGGRGVSAVDLDLGQRVAAIEI